MSLDDIRRLQIGQVVDFVVAYNDRQKKAEKEQEGKRKRKATQGDIDSFFG